MTKSNRLILIFILAFALIVGLSFASPQTTRALAAIDYSGEITIDLNSDQTRWSYSEVLNDYVWINWQLTIKGRRLL